MASDHGNMVCLQRFAPCIEYRPNAEWVDVGDGWACALYSHAQFAPEEYLRDRLDHLRIAVQDVTGWIWELPALLRPDGLPAVGMRNRAITSENGTIVIERQPATPLLADALEAASDMRAALVADQATFEDRFWWTCRIIAGAYHLDATTIARLGLIGDTLVEKSRLSAGLFKEEENAD